MKTGALVQDSAMGHGIVVAVGNAGGRVHLVRVSFLKRMSKPIWVTRGQIQIISRGAK